MIRQHRLVQFMGFVGLVSWLSSGCSGDEPPPPAPAADVAPSASAVSSAAGAATGESPRSAATTCADMQVRECRIELASQGAVHNCFVGLQLCKDAQWGPCQDADKREAQLSCH